MKFEVHGKFFFIVLFFAVIGSAATVSAEVYQWTDAQGNVYFGDSPPSGAKASEKKYREDRFERPARKEEKESDYPKVERLRDASAILVTLYVTNW